MKIGTAKRDITPRFSVDLSGYGARLQPCEGIHDPISVRAVVLQSGDKRVAISTVEILGFTSEQTSWLRRALAKEGYRPEDLVFCCTHTHGAPAVQALRWCGQPAQKYVDEMLASVAACIVEAGRKMQRCTAAVGYSQCDLGINRRAPGPRELVLGENPSGHRDTQVMVLQFKNERGCAVATLFNYGCHCVSLGGDNRLVTGDWAGVAMRLLECGAAGRSLFLQGCAGNINPRLKGNFDRAGDAGVMMVQSVQTAIQSALPLENMTISTNLAETQLPLMQNPSPASLLSRIGEIEALEKALWGWSDRRDYAWASDILAHPETANRPSTTFEVGEVSIGDVSILWLPAEAFSEYATAIKASRPLGRTLVLGYTNGNIGYLPTEAAYEEGGYEVDEAYKYYGFQMVGKDSERLVHETVNSNLIH